MTPDAQDGLRAKVARVEEALTEAYGPRVWRAENYQDDLVGALVATVLSQNTSDLNSGRAYVSLKQAFPGGWEDVRTASVTDLADSIRAGGLANVKAPRIQAILQDVYDRNGRTDLDHIRHWDDQTIRDYLRSFHGIGPKTAACVLMFNLGRPVLPVDTHVGRVARRLGLIGPKVSADQAHDDLQGAAGRRSGVSVPRPLHRARPPRLPLAEARLRGLPRPAGVRFLSGAGLGGGPGMSSDETKAVLRSALEDDGMCFGCGPRNAIGLRLTFAWDGDTYSGRAGRPPASIRAGRTGCMAACWPWFWTRPSPAPRWSATGCIG